MQARQGSRWWQEVLLLPQTSSKSPKKIIFQVFQKHLQSPPKKKIISQVFQKHLQNVTSPMVCQARHATGRLVHTICPECGMVLFTLCLVRHVGGWPLFFLFLFYPAPCNWVASVHIVPSVPCNWAAINPTTRPRVHNYYTRPSAPWSAWHMCWKIIHSMSTWVFLKCPNANTNETYIPVENFQKQH